MVSKVMELLAGIGWLVVFLVFLIGCLFMLPGILWLLVTENQDRRALYDVEFGYW